MDKALCYIMQIITDITIILILQLVSHYQSLLNNINTILWIITRYQILTPCNTKNVTHSELRKMKSFLGAQ